MEAIGQLAAGVAHDFNNVLTIIHGHASMLSMRLGAEGPHAKSLVEIRRAAERATSLVRQLLAFSRKQILQFRNVELNDVIASLSGMLKQRDQYLDLLRRLEAGSAAIAQGDPGFSLFAHVDTVIGSAVGRDRVTSMNPSTKNLSAEYQEESVVIKLTQINLGQLVSLLFQVEKGDRPLRWLAVGVLYGLAVVLLDKPDDVLAADRLDVSMRGSVLLGGHIRDV